MESGKVGLCTITAKNRNKIRLYVEDDEETNLKPIVPVAVFIFALISTL